jgi:hypothetical protein
MTPEALICDALKHLADGRVLPDFAPENTEAPFIVYQVVGGEPINYLTGEQPDKQKVRIQVSVWAGQDRIEASELGAAVEAAIRAATALQPEVASGRIATYDEETRTRGTRQDFYLLC